MFKEKFGSGQIIFRRDSMESGLSQHDKFEAFKKYLAAKTSPITNEAISEPEPEDVASAFEEFYDLTVSAKWEELVVLNSLRYIPFIAKEPDPIYVTEQTTESPFDKLSDLQTDNEKVFEIIEHVRHQLNLNFNHRLSDRLNFLFEASKEEDPDDMAIAPDSLKHFIGFIQSVPHLKYPDLVLSPSKNIRALWRTGPNRHFAVEFLTTGDVYFVIFSPDQKHPEKIIRLSGQVSVDSLMETAQPHGVITWSSQ